MKFPSEKDIKKAERAMRSRPTTLVPPSDASKVDLIKYKLCSEFIRYFNAHNLTQTQLARQMGLDQGTTSRILRYKVSRITIDFLVSHLENLIEKDIRISISNRKAS